MGMLPVKKFHPGDVIIREGEIGRDAFLIQLGRVRLSRRADGQDKILGDLGENDLLGELSIISQSPRQYTATALVETRAIAIPAGRLSILIERSPEMAAMIIKTLIRKLTEANARDMRALSFSDWNLWRRSLYLILLLSAVGNDGEDDVYLPNEDLRTNLSIGLGLIPAETNGVMDRLTAANLVALHVDSEGGQVVSLRLSDINLMYNYIDQTYSPGSAEPMPSLEEATRQVSMALLDLCRRHYGDLSTALSTFKRSVLIEFIASSSILQSESQDMRRRLIGLALDDLKSVGFLQPVEGEEKDVVSIDLSALDTRVEADQALVCCRERYAILSQSERANEKITL